jgi:predicted  nucleic acid-binding Zn-ribbon protein
MEGCDKCGNKFFFYVRETEVKRAEEDIKKLSKKEIEEIESDIRDIIGSKAKNEAVVLDVEAIRVIKPGKYQIDVTTLFNQIPIVIRVGSGRYELDLSTIMKKMEQRKG